MAARKSCTHMTWAEAKAKTGQLATSGQRKNKEVLRKQNHGAVLAAKIISKQGGDVMSAENKKLQKQYRKQEEKAAALAAARHEEREQKRLAALQEVKPYDRVQEKLAEQLQALREADTELPAFLDHNNNVDWKNNPELQRQIVECKQMQLDELLALEAMIPEDEFVVSTASNIAELRDKLDQWAADEDNEILLASICQHAPISLIIKLHVDDYRDDNRDNTDELTEDMDLNMTLLLRVTLPPLYLNNSSEASQVPHWDFITVMVTDKNELCSADRALESLAWLDEAALKTAMTQHATNELLPYPCVYELAVTWLSENIFGFIRMQSHLLATK